MRWLWGKADNVRDECGIGVAASMGWQGGREWRQQRGWLWLCGLAMVLASCKWYGPHRMSNRKHRRMENRPESPSWWAPVVNDEMWLTWVTFAVGAWWSALRVGVRLGEQGKGWCRPLVTRGTRGRWGEAGMELDSMNGVVFTAYLCTWVWLIYYGSWGTHVIHTKADCGCVTPDGLRTQSSSWYSGAQWMGRGTPVGESQHWSQPKWDSRVTMVWSIRQVLYSDGKTLSQNIIHDF